MEWWLNHVGQMAQSVQDYSIRNKSFGNDLGFDIIMGGNDYEFIGKTNVDNK